ncbi:MAG: DUF58 domain-containing protein [Thermoguttaceae bacterium]|nr:DUF58 domain-containing protein [Thermoguttaceae bacterium]
MKIRTRVNRDGLVFLGILAIVLLGAIIRQVNLLLLFGSILACFGLFDYRAGRRSLQGLTARRLPVAAQAAGSPLRVPIRLTSTRRRGRSYAVAVEDTVTPTTDRQRRISPRQSPESPQSRSKHRQNGDAQRYRPICYFDAVRPSQSVTELWTGTFPQRGRYQLGPITISTRYPLGFFRSSVTLPAEGDFYIGPKLGNLWRPWLSSLRRKIAEDAARRNSVDRTGEELFGIRQWQPMDQRKWIHQHASAKYQKLLVRQYQNRTLQSAAVILDLFGPQSADSLEEQENQELAVCFAATLIDELVKKQKMPAAFGLIARLEDGGARYFCQNASAAGTAAEIARHLATAEPTGQDTLPEILRQCAAVGALSQIILVTTRPLEGERRQRCLSEEPARQLLTRTTIVDTGSKEFDTLFWFDPPRGDTPQRTSPDSNGEPAEN